MKNIRLLIGTLCCVALWLGLTANPAAAQTAVTVPGDVALEIESRHLTQAQADALVQSGEKVTLDVYLVLKGSAWLDFINADEGVRINNSRLSYVFFDDKTYTIGNYLPNPTDHVTLCVNSLWTPPAGVTSTCTPTNDREGLWYTLSPQWQRENGGAGLTLDWPTYAYGAGFSGTVFLPSSKYFIADGDNYKIRLFALQFILKDAGRDYPVAIVDEDFPNGLNGSTGATELNLTSGDDGINYLWPGAVGTPDWTEAPAKYFEFIPGGLFIERAPEVEKIERSFIA